MHQTQGYCKLCVITAQKIKIFTKKMKKHIFFLWLALLQIQIVASELTHRPTHTTLTHSTHTPPMRKLRPTPYTHTHTPALKRWTRTPVPNMCWRPPGNPRKSTEIRPHKGSNRGPPPPEERVLHNCLFTLTLIPLFISSSMLLFFRFWL